MAHESWGNKENEGISDDVKNQLENLGLSIDDIKGTVLDVGSGDAQLAKELKRITGKDIISLDEERWKEDPGELVLADVRKLPFNADSFDKVISHASIPNIFVGMYSEEFPELSEAEIKKSILTSFREMLRILKPGSQAIMAPVRVAYNHNSEKALTKALEDAIEEIEKEGVDVFFEMIREMENPDNKEKYQQYRLTLVKKERPYPTE